MISASHLHSVEESNRVVGCVVEVPHSCLHPVLVVGARVQHPQSGSNLGASGAEVLGSTGGDRRVNSDWVASGAGVLACQGNNLTDSKAGPVEPVPEPLTVGGGQRACRQDWANAVDLVQLVSSLADSVVALALRGGSKRRGVVVVGRERSMHGQEKSGQVLAGLNYACVSFNIRTDRQPSLILDSRVLKHHHKVTCISHHACARLPPGWSSQCRQPAQCTVNHRARTVCTLRIRWCRCRPVSQQSPEQTGTRGHHWQLAQSVYRCVKEGEGGGEGRSAGQTGGEPATSQTERSSTSTTQDKFGTGIGLFWEPPDCTMHVTHNVVLPGAGAFTAECRAGTPWAKIANTVSANGQADRGCDSVACTYGRWLRCKG